MSLGPRHGPITVGQIDEALAESPGYDLIVFAGFAATAEAQQYLAPGKRGPGQRRAARSERRPPARRPAEEHQGVADLPSLRGARGEGSPRTGRRGDDRAPRHGQLRRGDRRGDLAQPGRDRRLVPRPRLRRVGLPRQPGVLHAVERLGGAGQGAQGHDRSGGRGVDALVHVAAVPARSVEEGRDPRRRRRRPDQRSDPRRSGSAMAKAATAEAQVGQVTDQNPIINDPHRGADAPLALRRRRAGDPRGSAGRGLHPADGQGRPAADHRRARDARAGQPHPRSRARVAGGRLSRARRRSPRRFRALV